MKSNSSTYSFMDCAFGVVFKKFLPNPDRYKVTRFSPGFFLRFHFVFHSFIIYLSVIYFVYNTEKNTFLKKIHSFPNWLH